MDELKKGPFTLRVQVLEYRQVDAGVEVDVCLTATARTGCAVWESVLTLLSKNKSHKASRCLPRKESESEQPFSDDKNVFSLLFYAALCLIFTQSTFTLDIWLTQLVQTQTLPGFLDLSGQPDEAVSENVKQVEVRIPRSAGLRCVWSFCDFSPYWLLSLPARLFGCRLQASPSLWMLSVCLAEIEKHKGNRF